MYNHSMNPNRTPIYQRPENSHGVNYPPTYHQRQNTSHRINDSNRIPYQGLPSLMSLSAARYRQTPTNNFDFNYQTPRTQQTWSDPTKGYSSLRSQSSSQSYSRKRIFNDTDEAQENFKRRRNDNQSISNKTKSPSRSSSSIHKSPTSQYQSTSQDQTRTLNSPKDVDSLSQDIWSNFLKKRQKVADLKKKVSLRNDLAQVIKLLFPYGALFLVGSSMNGFGSAESDVDLCLMISNSIISQKNTAKSILHRLLVELSLKCFHFVRKPQVIPAKVPILKFFDCFRKLECDLNINNSTGIRNTYLMQLYSKLDWRVAPLILTIKEWASKVGINDASQGTLSSYSLVLMTLYYLQAGVKPPVLISLQQKYPEKFNSRTSVWDLQSLAPEDSLPSWVLFESQNKMNLRELLEGFMKFYTTSSFQFYKDVVSVRLGTPLLLSSFENVGDWKKKFIHIEEPFDQTNTARAVYSECSFKLIMMAFRRAANKLSRRENRKVKDLY